MKPLFLCIGTLHGSLCPIGAFSFWAFIPYSFLITPSHPVKSIILFSTFLLPTNEREIKHPPPPKKKGSGCKLFLQWLKISYFTVYSRFSHFVLNLSFVFVFAFVFFFCKINLLLAEKST